MRQADENFSRILTKIGNGECLDPDEQTTIESRFVSKDWCDEHRKNAVRLFHKNEDVDKYNDSAVQAQWISNSIDKYTGHTDEEELRKLTTLTDKLCTTKSLTCRNRSSYVSGNRT